MQEIFKGSAPNDKTGTPARQASDIINDNFAYLDAKISNIDQIKIQTGYSLLGQDFTMNAGWVWDILGVEYTNPVDVVRSIPFASTGLQRLDMFVLNQSNTYTYIAGEESEIAVKPPIPINTIEAFLVLVGDESVGEPTAPVLGEDYKLKSESTDIIINYYDAVIEQINLYDNKSSLSLTGSVTDIKSVQVSGQFIYPGKPHFVKNRSGRNVTIWHNAGTGNIKYSFPNAQNYIIKPNEVLEFNTNANDSSVVKFEFVGASISVLAEAKAYTDSIAVGLYKYKGSVANYASLPSSGQTVGDVWNLLDTNMNYGWTGSVWDPLGSTVDISGKEDSSNKKNTIAGNEASTSFFGTIKGWIDWFKNGFASVIPAKATSLVDTDLKIIFDSEDGFKTKTRTFAQEKATLKAYFDTQYSIMNFNQSRWQFSDYTNTSANQQGPYIGAVLASGTISASGVTSVGDLNSLGAIAIFCSTSANSGYRSSDVGVAFSPRQGITFLGRIGLSSDTSGRDRLIRIGFHSTVNQFLPVNGVYLEIAGASASFKTTSSSVTTSSSSVTMDDSQTGASIVYYSVFITFTADRRARCVLYDYTMTAVLTVTFTTADNMPVLGVRFNSGIVATITTAGVTNAICNLDYMGAGIAKPSFLNNY